MFIVVVGDATYLAAAFVAFAASDVFFSADVPQSLAAWEKSALWSGFSPFDSTAALSTARRLFMYRLYALCALGADGSFGARVRVAFTTLISSPADAAAAFGARFFGAGAAGAAAAAGAATAAVLAVFFTAVVAAARGTAGAAAAVLAVLRGAAAAAGAAVVVAAAFGMIAFTTKT